MEWTQCAGPDETPIGTLDINCIETVKRLANIKEISDDLCGNAGSRAETGLVPGLEPELF